MKRPIIALYFPDKQAISKFLDHFPRDESLYLKVGMELYYREGPAIVKWLISLGHDIFLDLKCHDIPNTVERTMENIASLGIKLTNVHAAGGSAMMSAAIRGLEAGSGQAPRPVLIAVTQLTSTSEEQVQEEQLIKSTLIQSVCHYARLAMKSGLDGVVCSALEVADIKKVTRDGFICLTPGIRTTKSITDDQKRVVTPSEANKIGSDYIVVGRPITQSEKPYESYLEIKKMWNGVLV